MKKYLVLFSLLISFIILGIFVYYKQIALIPTNIAESREKIVSVDKIRFAFKVSTLTQKGLSAYCYAVEKGNSKSLEDSIDFFNAAYAFMMTEYTKNENLVEYIEPKLLESIDIVETNGLNISDSDMNRLKALAFEVSNQAEKAEQITWKRVQDQYIEYQLKEYKIKVILQVTMIFIVALIVMVVLLFYRINNNRKQEVEKLQRLIDIQHDIIIVTNGRKLLFANKIFLDFFGYDSIEQFKEHYNCICDRFIEDEHFFHLGKVKSSEAHWVQSLLNLPGRERIVSLADQFNHVYAFSVSINIYDQHSYIVNFHDVSDVMLEKLNLIRQAIHDNLTKAYNRTYFENNLVRLIDRHQNDSKQTGVIMIDIDHFKEVNDTFGHKAGDDILVQVVEVIQKNCRDSDKLIRWGGEEFMIILPANSIEDVSKQAEHLRSKIQQHVFSYVQKLTCSFGCAIYSDQHDIEQIIRLADQNLYYSKQNGRNRVTA